MFRTVQSSCQLVSRFINIRAMAATKKYSLHESAILKNSSNDFTKITVRGELLKYPNVWLRENCQCNECFHESAKSRIVDWSNFNVNIKPVEVCENEDSVEITWEDDHKSKFGLDWLTLRSFTSNNQKIYYNTIYKPIKKIWHGKDFSEICTRHSYNEVLHSDQALHDFLEKLSIFGVAVIENTPDDETASNQIVAKIGFPKQTHYGVQFIVQSVQNTSNVAYLSSNLPLHVDLPYYEYCPGVNMLHCLVQTESQGGENLLSDGHFTADYMRSHHPEEYRLLTEVEVEWSDIGTEAGHEFYKLHRAPVVCVDKHHNITRINFSIPQRGNYFPGDINLVKPWYEAHSLFLNLNTQFAAQFKPKVGEILVFDNIRLLHGRNRYEDRADNVRKLIGTYVDWDEVYSRLRCLKVKLEDIKGL